VHLSKSTISTVHSTTAIKHSFIIHCSPICMLRPSDTEQANLAQ